MRPDFRLSLFCVAFATSLGCATATVTLRADDAGRVVEVPVGEPFAVELLSLPSTGYRWAPSELPGFLTHLDAMAWPTASAQSLGLVGGSHREVHQFQARTAGTGALVLEQRRPWELNAPPVETFSVTIEAK